MYSIESLPLPPFTWAVVGPTNCGKTYMVTHCLRTWIKNKVFLEKNIHVFCPTANMQDGYSEFKEIHLYDTPHSDSVDKIKEGVERVKREYGIERVPRILIIYDDCFSSDKTKNTMRSNIVAELATHGRHYNICQILLSQQLNGIAKPVRLNCQYFSMFEPNAVLEAEDFLTQMVFRSDRTSFLQNVIRIWSKKYAFLHVITSVPGLNKFREGFDKYLFNSKKVIEYCESSDEDDDEAYMSDDE